MCHGEIEQPERKATAKVSARIGLREWLGVALRLVAVVSDRIVRLTLTGILWVLNVRVLLTLGQGVLENVPELYAGEFLKTCWLCIVVLKALPFYPFHYSQLPAQPPLAAL